MGFARGAYDQSKILRTENLRVPMSIMTRNVSFWLDKALRGEIPQVMGRPMHHTPLAVVGGGASAGRYLKELSRWQLPDHGGEIWAMNGAYDWLRDNGIQPNAMMILNPERDMVAYLQKCDPKTRFYVCSTSDPALWECFRHFGCKDVWLYHMQIQDGENTAMQPRGPGISPFAIQGGPSVTTRAPFLGYILGFRHFHIFGADSSFNIEGGATHVYGRNDSDRMQTVIVECGGQKYRTQMAMVAQAQYFNWLARAGGDIDLNFHGVDNLLGAMLENNAEYKVVAAAVHLPDGKWGDVLPVGTVVDQNGKPVSIENFARIKGGEMTVISRGSEAVN